MDELLECLNTADILKPAKAAAVEVLQVLGKQLKSVLVCLCVCSIITINEMYLTIMVAINIYNKMVQYT